MKHKVKRVLSIVMALTLGCALTVPVIAKETDADEPEAKVVAEVATEVIADVGTEEIEVYAEEIDEEYGVALMAETDFSDWSVLTAQGGTLTTGRYYLDQDVTLRTDITIPSGAEVTIDLNGHALKATGTDSAITNYGTFTLEDSSGDDSGTLTGPTDAGSDIDSGGGVFNSKTFNLSGGEISKNSGRGAGVYNEGDLTMTGGKITENTVSDESGVGVYNYGDFSMSGGEISGNTTAYTGGGVVNMWNFTFSGGKINDNSAEDSGGVYSNWNFTMIGGEICGNSASKSGGGVKIGGNEFNDAVFTMTDGIISNNTAGTGGGGVDAMGSYYYDSYIYLCGTPVISGNTVNGEENNVNLHVSATGSYPDCFYITLKDALLDGAYVGVTTSSAPMNYFPVQVTSAESNTNYYASSVQYFHSDAGYGMQANDTGKYVELYYTDTRQEHTLLRSMMLRWSRPARSPA